MKIENIFEIIEPRVSHRKYRGRFNRRGNNYSHRKETSFGNRGNGAFGYVTNDKNDPHMIKKTTRSAVKREYKDGYWGYVEKIIEHKLWENPYFPRIYKKASIEDKDEDIFDRVVMEKLEEFDIIDKKPRDVDALFRKIFGDNARVEHTELLSYELAEIVFEYVMTGHVPGYISVDEQEFDTNFVKAVDILKDIGGDREKFAWDLRKDNMMLRRGPHGFQLVFTDPFA